MADDILLELDEDCLRGRLSKYTQKAYRMLPELTRPRILDIGCGSGIPTLELARLSDGQIIGLDVDQSLLDRLNKKIEEEGFTSNIKTIRCSMFEMDFPDESFDVIWSEGSIAQIGFGKGLTDWRRLLKPGGFLVVHDEEKNLAEKLRLIADCGYCLLGHFTLPGDIWWADYFNPLQERILELEEKYGGRPEVLKELVSKKKEAAMVKNSPQDFGSVFFVMQKKEEEH
jgi:ubiquinone/menaquinone biosynthesis C-methylase UbiE